MMIKFLKPINRDNRTSHFDMWTMYYIDGNKYTFFDNYYQCSCEIWGSTGVLKNNRVFTAKDNYEATIEIYSNSTKDVEILKFPTENQFLNMLDYVKKLIFKNDYESELEESLVQIKLVSSFLRMSKSFNL